MIPSDIIGWLSIGLATASAASFVGLNLKNYFAALQGATQISAGSTMLGGLVIMLCLFSFFLKLWFFKHVIVGGEQASGQGPVATTPGSS